MGGDLVSRGFEFLTLVFEKRPIVSNPLNAGPKISFALFGAPSIWLFRFSGDYQCSLGVSFMLGNEVKY